MTDDGATYQIRKTFDPRTFSVVEELVQVDAAKPDRKAAPKKVAAPKPKPVKAAKAAKPKKAKAKKKV